MTIPAAAEMIISRIGDSFFFAKCLYPNIEATRMAVRMIAWTLTLIAEIAPKQLLKTI